MGGDVGDFFFGSEGQPGRAEDITPAEFRRLRGPTAGGLRRFIDSGGGPRFEGPFTADMTGGEEEFLRLARGAGRPSEEAGVARDLFARTAGGEFLSPESNPFLADTIRAAQRPVVQQFEDVTMPRLRSQFTRAGQRVQADPRTGEGQSSPFDRSAALASRGLAQELGDISTRIAGENFQAERGRQMQAAGAIPELDRAQLEQVMSGLEAQALPRLIEQHGIDRGLEEFRRRRDALFSALQAAGGLSAPTPVTFQPTQGTEGLVQGVFKSFAGGLGQGLGSTGGSDARLKENVRASEAPALTDEQVRRIRAVDFDMDGEAGSGVIAQELEDIGLGELVVRDTDTDYRLVDYGGLAARLINTLQRNG